MLTKAIIKAKSPSGDSYSVRIPYLEKPNTGPRIEEAVLSHEPALRESYKPGDVVVVGFEDHNADKPVILGKLRLPGEEPRGNASLHGLEVTGSASLPDDTAIGGISADRIKEAIREVEYVRGVLGNPAEPVVGESINVSVASIRVPTGRQVSVPNAAADDSDGDSDKAMSGEVAVTVRIVGRMEPGDEVVLCKRGSTKERRFYTSADGTEKVRFRERYTLKTIMSHSVTEEESRESDQFLTFMVPFDPSNKSKEYQFYRTNHTQQGVNGTERLVRVRRMAEPGNRNTFVTVSNQASFHISHSTADGDHVRFW